MDNVTAIPLEYGKRQLEKPLSLRLCCLLPGLVGLGLLYPGRIPGLGKYIGLHGILILWAAAMLMALVCFFGSLRSRSFALKGFSIIINGGWLLLLVISRGFYIPVLYFQIFVPR